MPSRFERYALLLTLPAGVVVLALYAYPILQVLSLSLTEGKGALYNYTYLFHSRAVAKVVRTTASVGIYTTAITLVIAYAIAFGMIHMKEGQRRIAMLLVLIPFWISVLVRAFAWITILRSQGILNGALMGMGVLSQPLELVYNRLGVTIGMVHYMVPFAVLLIYANLTDIDRRVIQAARSLGARPMTVFLKVWLPMSAAGIGVASLFVMVFTLGFLVTPALLGGGKTLMIAEYISVQISTTRRWDLATSLSTALLIVVAVLIAIALRSPAMRSAFGGARK
ncbi:MAG: polyamine ABC transporter permease [Rhodobacteraceae bacterium]|nr:polyamine ABC transporter permease [Paracoccaceae bacterium]MAY47437.1 polyamine ABC transporter permease [Paracoccaceae bacterium]|tara:strand:- start:90 stop:932 length:843 start_codon:yes stop_codon:yes gene_type:complete